MYFSMGEFLAILAIMAGGWILVPWELMTPVRSLIIFVYLVIIAVSMVALVEKTMEEAKRWWHRWHR